MEPLLPPRAPIRPAILLPMRSPQAEPGEAIGFLPGPPPALEAGLHLQNTVIQGADLLAEPLLKKTQLVVQGMEVPYCPGCARG